MVLKYSLIKGFYSILRGCVNYLAQYIEIYVYKMFDIGNEKKNM